MSKSNLKDKLEDDTLDLSLSDLKEVPVKEIAALPKAKVLDLSCNQLTTLPDDFCSLIQLTRLDLSKNRIAMLPVDFGRLRNLKQLDVLGNRLTTFPLSMAHLARLEWLDVKDNTLPESWTPVVGDCLNDKQCRQCAKNVIGYLKTVQSEQERERQKRLQEEREAEAEREKELTVEREQKKKEKAVDKERRRREWEARRQEEARAARQHSREAGDYDDDDEEEEEERKEGGAAGKSRPEAGQQKSRGWCCTLCIFLTMTVIALALAVGCIAYVHVFCEENPQDQMCRSYGPVVEPYWRQIHKVYRKFKMPNRVFADA